MTLEKDENTADLQSSEQVNDATEDTAAPADGDGAAASSAADEPKDMLSVVRDVVGPEEPDSSAGEKKAEDAGAEDGVSGEAEDKTEQDDTDYSDVPFNKHPRFQQLLEKAKRYETDAGRYQNIEGFLKQNHLTADEAADGLNIMALAKVDPKRALEQIKPFVQQLLIATGDVLPEDLKSRVQKGELSPNAAMEISRANAEAAHQRTLQQAADKQRETDATTQRAEALRTTAASWLQDRDQRDPAFESKYPLLEREVALMQRKEGVPGTPEGVRDQLQRAYDAVNKQVRAAAPAPRRPEVRPITGGGAPGKTSPQPTSMLEAIRAARGT